MKFGSPNKNARAEFTYRLLELLRLHPNGLSEFEIIRALEAEGEPGFDGEKLRDNLTLFQSHFFLFHHLYLLQEELLIQGEAYLEIGPLNTKLHPVSDSSSKRIDQHDRLREYYLQLDNLENTTTEQVEQLLSQFWDRLLKNDKRAEALAVLGLQDPVGWITIKTRYRQLVMRHHPDRGGDLERLQLINAALETLKGTSI